MSLQATYGEHTTDNLGLGCVQAETVILAVKPRVAEYGECELNGKLLISIATGVPVARQNAMFGPVANVWTMPDTPMLLGLGATGLYANSHVDTAQRARARSIVNTFGLCVDLPREDLLGAGTAVSGSDRPMSTC